jgi:protein O-GlcNAc transferase
MNEALLRNANHLLGQGRQREALDYYERFLAAEPGVAEAWHNRGSALAQLKSFGEAVASYDRALALRPDSAQTWNNRAHALVEEKRYAEAARDYEKALALDPEFPFARGYRLAAKLWCCDWAGLEEEKAKIAAGLAHGARVIHPFAEVMLATDPEAQAQAARIWMLGRYGAPVPLWRGAIYRHDKMRVAYLSADFRRHPVAYLMAEVFEAHDRAQFAILGVSFGPDDKSDIRARLAAGFDRFVDARGASDLEIATLLRQNEIDIAVDLMGLTADSRSGIFAHRPAPVQVNYLGFPGTMAAPFIDYILADRIVIPDMERDHYREKVVYLPHSYMACDSRRPIAAPKWTRADVGLPDSGLVFASFNNPYKIQPQMFAIWMRLVTSVEGSVLWLSAADADGAENLRREAAVRGVDPERLVFAPHLESHAEHLARIALADLFLDTIPFNAHTTANDALWAGLPVLTCAGTTFAGRVAASLLQAAGLPELITHSLGEYEAVALKLARDRDALAGVRARLAAKRKTAPLFDTARFTLHLESAYRRMVESRRSSAPPVGFAVESVA